MVYKSGQIFLPFCHNSRLWRTDGQTDGQTDRILIARPRLHYISAVKISAPFKYVNVTVVLEHCRNSIQF